MLENIKLLDLVNTIILLSTFLTSLGIIQKWTTDKMEKMFKPINRKIDKEHLDRLRSDIVSLMCSAENGTLSEEQKILAHEEYDEYTKLGGNSYVHSKWDKLEKEGKI